ncbi:MAG: sigma-70 family RNA polymerase sigma factor [Clostridia bacterium]|nr:sigma-70 family RNA polymerase sigma factor [Clostridia bacterium]
MQDHEIIELYFARNEQAIVETDKQYGAACMRVSLNILNSRLDAEECVSDTYLKAWNSIPPRRPNVLKAFLCRITRNLSLTRYRQLHRAGYNKDLEVSFDELEACIPMPEEHSSYLAGYISDFLKKENKQDRLLFMGRYFHACSTKELANLVGMTESNVNVRLHRTRERLRTYLMERGYSL